jgi:rhamnosyltransferase
MSDSVRCPEVFAVIVTFNPDLQGLSALLEQLLPQVGGAIIVDNGSSVDLDDWRRQHPHYDVELLRIGENRGIGAAQNAGIEHARRHGVGFVLLSDQDSLPAPDMVRCLKQALRELQERGVRVAAVGPRYLDVNQNRLQPFIRVKGVGIEKLWCDDAKAVFEVDYVIASGCLVPMHALDAIGGMCGEIFIDYVDVEWGLRARRHGYRCYGVCAASMRHRHGETALQVMGRQYVLHSPLRHYYRTRNAIWLYKQRYVPLRWKVADGIGLLRRYLLYSLFARPRFDHWRMMTLGLMDGLRSRLGRFGSP